MRFDDTRTEWRVADIESKTNANTQKLYEVDSLRSRVGSLECSLREARSDNDGLRSQIQMQESSIAEIKEQLIDLTTRNIK